MANQIDGAFQVKYSAPGHKYEGTKAAIEALTVTEGASAYATDTNLEGFYNGTVWVWGGGVPVTTAENDFQVGGVGATVGTWVTKTYTQIKALFKSYFDTIYQPVPINYAPTAIAFGNAAQEYDIDGITWVTATAGVPDAVGHLLPASLTAIATPYDAKYLAVSENTGAASATNPLTVQFTFPSVTTFNVIKFRVRYVGSASHDISFELYNGSTWDIFDNFTTTADYELHSSEVLVPTSYVIAGTVLGRFRHEDNGVNTHYILIDYIVIGSGGGGGGGSIQAAHQTPFAPAGTIAATDVQAAIVELDSEKAATSQKLDDFGTPDDNTDLNATTTYHGLLKKLSNVSTEFMNGAGNWATPAGSGGAPATTAANDFQVGDGAGAWIKKTLAETITILGIFADAASDSVYYVRRNAGWTNAKTYFDTLYSTLASMSASNATDLTDGGATTLHSHAGLVVPETSANDVYTCSNPGGASGFTALINGTPTSVPNSVITFDTVSIGAVARITPTAAGQLGKLRLYNTTRGDYALIISATGATVTVDRNVITDMAVPWANNDAITCASPTVGAGWFDIEINTGSLMGKSGVHMVGFVLSATAGDVFRIHPFTADTASKRQTHTILVATIAQAIYSPIPLTSNVFSITWSGTWTGTCFIALREAEYVT